MQQTQALAEVSSFANSASGTGVIVPETSPDRGQIWRGRIAVGALLGISGLGYALALFAIDAVVKGGGPALF